MTADIPHTYVAYGTVVESTISLSELLSEASDKDRETTAGVSVIEESLPRHPDGLNSEATEVYTDSSEGLRIFRLDDGFFLVYRGIGTLRIQPDRISVSQEATASRADIRWLVVSLGLRLALVQRGGLVFHASAVVIDGSLVAFTGPSGRGKSTLAAACFANGHVHHSDDLVPLLTTASDDRLLVPPGPPRLRVNRDVTRPLCLSSLTSTSEGGKLQINTSRRHSETARELDVLYLVEDADRIAINEVSTQQAVFELLCNSYALYRDSDIDSASDHLQICSETAHSTDVRTLSRPRSFRKLDDLVTALEDDISDSYSP